MDTNVLASAFATRGLCSDVFRIVLAEHQLVTSLLVLEELERTLRQKFKVRERLIRQTLDFLEQDAVLAAAAQGFPVDVSDESDAQILSSALAADAEIFITGDKELLALQKLQRLRILSPRQFWERTKQS